MTPMTSGDLDVSNKPCSALARPALPGVGHWQPSRVIIYEVGGIDREKRIGIIFKRGVMLMMEEGGGGREERREGRTEERKNGRR